MIFYKKKWELQPFYFLVAFHTSVLLNAVVALTSNLVISEIAGRLELHNNKEVIKLVQNETARFIITISTY